MIKAYFHERKKEEKSFSIESDFLCPLLLCGKESKHVLDLMREKNVDKFEGLFEINNIDILSERDPEKIVSILDVTKKIQVPEEDLKLEDLDNQLNLFLTEKLIEETDYFEAIVKNVAIAGFKSPAFIVLNLEHLSIELAKLVVFFVRKVFAKFPIIIYCPKLDNSVEDIEFIDYLPNIDEVVSSEEINKLSQGFDAFIDDVFENKAPVREDMLSEEKVVSKPLSIELHELVLGEELACKVVAPIVKHVVKEEPVIEEKVEQKEEKPVDTTDKLNFKEFCIGYKNDFVSECKSIGRGWKNYFSMKGENKEFNKNNVINFVFAILFIALSTITSAVFFIFGKTNNKALLNGVCLSMSIVFVILSSLPISYLFTDAKPEKYSELPKHNEFAFCLLLVMGIAVGWGGFLLGYAPKLNWETQFVKIYSFIYICYPIIHIICLTLLFLKYFKYDKVRKKKK